jgi:acyl-homoserine lactone acylase PvdQ
VPTIQRVFQQTLAYLKERFGSDMSAWQWSRLHVMPLRHVLANRGDLGQLLNHGNVSVRGDMTTVCNTGCDPDWLATTGAGYRLIADLSTSTLMAVDGQSQSGNPLTPHYSDQLDDWLSGRYHALPLARADVSDIVVETLTLQPE